MTRIFLIGYMGAGKTTVGRLLAKQMNLSFIDLDKYIEARYHCTIRQLFEEKGEEGFREIERKMLHEVAQFEDVLISTGGGAPCFYDNMAFMNEMGTTVYLKVSPAGLVKRLGQVRRTRPVLGGRSGKELEQFVAENLEKRTPCYMQASLVFDAEAMTTKRDINGIVAKMAQLLRQPPSLPASADACF